MFRDWEAPMSDMIWELSTALSWQAQRTTEAYRDTGFIMNFLSHNQSDYLQKKIQFNHSKKLWANLIDVHLHLIPMATTSWNFVVSVQYTRVSYNEVIPAITWWTNAGDVTIPLLWTDQYKHCVKSFLVDVTPPANETVSSVMLIKLTRVPAVDTYEWSKDHWTASANIGVLFVDAHMPTERFGWPLN
jgi:hypothetical protein